MLVDRGTGGLARPVAALLGLALALVLRGSGSAQTPTTLMVDAVSEGNSATALKAVDGCSEVDVGDEFTIDIAVGNVSNLYSWEATVVYDENLLQIVNQDTRLFLASKQGSRPLDGSEQLEDYDGEHLLAAADLSSATESGTGVLARLSFRALAPGFTLASMPHIDFDHNGTIDAGPRLLGPKSVPIGDTNADGFFDGAAGSAVIAIDRDCSEVTPSPTPGATAAPGATAQASPGGTSGGDEPVSATGGGPGGGGDSGDAGDGSGESPGSGPDSPGRPGEDGGGDGAGSNDSGGSLSGGSGGFPWLVIIVVTGLTAALGGGLIALLSARGRRL